MTNNYRNLTAAEIAQLERQGNYCRDWSLVRVGAPFAAECVRNSTFEGAVSLGALEAGGCTNDSLHLSEGIYNSMLRNVAVGDHTAIHNVRFLADYTIGDRCLLFNIGEMMVEQKVGAWQDNDGKVYTVAPNAWLEPMNENGGRRILPFVGMTIGDAYLWARYRGRKTLMERLEKMTYAWQQTEEGHLGQVGDGCTIKNTSCIRNVAFRSRMDDPTRVEQCIMLGDGVVGYGCTLEHGIIAERFLLGEHVHLEFGLRLNDTVVGDNSTLARCEVGNSIIFPAHEQHHNNSFLIAGLVMGQSNIAAGGTIGSNHNSRTADNELAAGRGFWPGLCCSFKHSSRFASYCLLAKADYPSELDITLPFALVNNNASKDQLEVMPAYWWMYNMYAMNRNSKKFAKRDKRKIKAQNIEFDNLAPDTAEEMLHGMELLKKWMAGSKDGIVYGEGMEKGKRRTVILKAKEGLQAYEEMLVYYAMKYLTATCGDALPSPTLGEGARCKEWVNLGGQLVAKGDMEKLIADVESGALDSWEALNGRLNTLWQAYPAQRDAHAYHVLCTLEGTDRLDDARWQRLLSRYADIQRYIDDQIHLSRHKDEVNPFRNMTYWDEEEAAAVLE
ncbi:MAG: DUF4954 family protein [Bacteroidales bacterium]|nr:DUF4954 family protein [Bacteroidales bacterium]